MKSRIEYLITNMAQYFNPVFYHKDTDNKIVVDAITNPYDHGFGEKMGEHAGLDSPFVEVVCAYLINNGKHNLVWASDGAKTRYLNDEFAGKHDPTHKKPFCTFYDFATYCDENYDRIRHEGVTYIQKDEIDKCADPRIKLWGKYPVFINYTKHEFFNMWDIIGSSTIRLCGSPRHPLPYLTSDGYCPFTGINENLYGSWAGDEIGIATEEPEGDYEGEYTWTKIYPIFVSMYGIENAATQMGNLLHTVKCIYGEDKAKELLSKVKTAMNRERNYDPEYESSIFD